ncbi:MAG: DUF2849 domain-containing protein [Alphaproteobacteria bacterium]|jgi:hypothetical protein|nr:DUF2849 domain-containing protein [Alphaproteobacteria bacterium]
MPRPFTPKVVTANRLLEGDAVWRTRDGDWSPDMAQAELIEDARTAELRLLEAAAEAHLVVGAYLADAARGETRPEPVHFREAFRTRGPSNYAHGKQTDMQEKT